MTAISKSGEFLILTDPYAGLVQQLQIPELAADIYRHGIYLTGGSTRLPYIDNYLASYTGFAFNLSDLYETSAAYGLEKIIRDRNLRKWAQPVKQKKL